MANDHEKAALTPEETKQLQDAVGSFRKSNRFEIIANDPPGVVTSSSFKDVNLRMNKQHELEVSMPTKDGLIATETFSADGKPTSDITLHAPALEKLGQKLQHKIIAAAEAESGHLQKPDPRQLLALEEKKAEKQPAVPLKKTPAR